MPSGHAPQRTHAPRVCPSSARLLHTCKAPASLPFVDLFLLLTCVTEDLRALTCKNMYKSRRAYKSGMGEKSKEKQRQEPRGARRTWTGRAQHGVSLVRWHASPCAGSSLPPAPTADQRPALGPRAQRREPRQPLLGTLVQRRLSAKPRARPHPAPLLGASPLPCPAGEFRAMCPSGSPDQLGPEKSHCLKHFRRPQTIFRGAGGDRRSLAQAGAAGHAATVDGPSGRWRFHREPPCEAWAGSPSASWAQGVTAARLEHVVEGRADPQSVLRCGGDPGMALPRGRREVQPPPRLPPSLSSSPTPDVPRAASPRAAHCDPCRHCMGAPSVAGLGSEGRLPARQAWKEAVREGISTLHVTFDL